MARIADTLKQDLNVLIDAHYQSINSPRYIPGEFIKGPPTKEQTHKYMCDLYTWFRSMPLLDAVSIACEKLNMTVPEVEKLFGACRDQAVQAELRKQTKLSAGSNRHQKRYK